MLKKLILLICLLFPVPGLAFANQANMIPCYVTDRPARVYAQPNSQSPVIFEIEAGTEIPLPAYAPNLDANWEPWYKIQFDEDGVVREGYVWHYEGIDKNVLKFGDVTFSYHIESDEENEFSARICLTAVNGKTIVSHSMEAMGFFGYPRFIPKSGRGLDNVQLILALCAVPDFCAPVFEYFWAWDGKRLLQLPLALYDTQPENDWYVEHLIFPAGGAPNNTIVKTIYYATEFDEGNNPLDLEYATIVYQWNGKEAVPITQNPDIINAP